MIKIDVLSNQQNPHIGSLACKVKVGKAEWKPLELFLCKKCNPKAIPHSWRNCKDEHPIKDLKVVEVLLPTVPVFRSLIWHVQKTAGPWIMTEDFCKSNFVVIPVALLFHIQFHRLSKSTHFLVPGTQPLIWQMLFSSILVEKDCQKEFNSTARPAVHLHCSNTEESNPSVLHHDSVCRDLHPSPLSLTRNIELLCQIDNDMLISPGR